MADKNLVALTDLRSESLNPIPIKESLKNAELREDPPIIEQR